MNSEMTREEKSISGSKSGAIAFMARNPVAANLLALVLVVGGILGLSSAKQEIFPQFDPDAVQVLVSYPGASPRDVEMGIARSIEESITGVTGVKRVRATSIEGLASVDIELDIGVSHERALSDIKNRVDGLRTLPEGALKPTVSMAPSKSRVLGVLVAGDLPLLELKQIAERVRTELLERKEISEVVVEGLPERELSIEIETDELRRLGLDLDQIARQVQLTALDAPSGTLRGPMGELKVRVSERRDLVEEYGTLQILPAGAKTAIPLASIAKIVDGFSQEPLVNYFNGKRAVTLTIYRNGQEKPAEIRLAAEEIIASQTGLREAGVELAVWRDSSQLLEARIDLLTRNAKTGLILVLIALATFLDMRLAFWVAAGIPVSFLGAMWLVPQMGLSINMVTLFAFIVTLGIVVDDAIVIGESIHSQNERGIDGEEGAIRGVKEVAAPVAFAILTTLAAFAPLFFLPGVMGKIFGILPVVVFAVLLVSWLESIFILPAHLAHSKKPNAAPSFISRVQKKIGEKLQYFAETKVRSLARFSLKWRAPVILSSIVGVLLSFALLKGDWVPYTFFPTPESDYLSANLRLPYGVSLDESERIQTEISAAAFRAFKKLDAEDELNGIWQSIGVPAFGGPPENGAHLLRNEISLRSSEIREISSEKLAMAWESELRDITGIKNAVVSFQSGPSAGAAIDTQLSHSSPEVLQRASEELEQALRQMPDLRNVESTFSSGKPQIDVKLSEPGRRLGLSAGDLGKSLRAATFGAEAFRQQRGRDEISVRVKLSEKERRGEAELRAFRVRTPSGDWAPLEQVATLTRNLSPSALIREDGRAIANVRAELRPGIKSNRHAISQLKDGILAKLKSENPGLQYEFSGSSRSESDVFGSLKKNYALALFVMYALLAVAFRSYFKPLIVMSVIPLGFAGAMLGHVVLQESLSVISLFGFVALSGVVVNDSIVLVDAIQRFQDDGSMEECDQAIEEAVVRRFRPIFLTSITTFLGLAPMILERSVQARFLVPMAISLGFGVLYTTFLVLMVVPALYSLLEQMKQGVKRTLSLSE